MATRWHPDICDCELESGPDGEPAKFVVQCEAHDGLQPSDVASECRAKERAREAIRLTLGLQQAPDWQRGKDGGHEIILPDGLDKATADRVAAAVAVVGDPELTKLTTLADIAAEATAVAATAAGANIKGA